MVNRTILCAGIILLSSPILFGPITAQPVAPQVKMFTETIREFNEKQDLAKSVRFEFSMEHTIYKGSSSAMEPNRIAKNGVKELNPDRDYIVKGNGGVSISGSQMRYWYDRPQWDPIGKKLYPESYIDTFDGKRFLRLFNPASGQKDYPLAQINMASTSDSAKQFPIAPVLLTFRGIQREFCQSIDEYKPSDRKTTIASRPCVELIFAAPDSQQREVLYLDQERGCIVRKAVLIDENPMWQLDITYQPDATVGWIPRSWEYVIRSSVGLQPDESGRYTVTNYKINTLLNDNEFILTFPPQSRVLDNSSGKQVQYVIRESGEKGITIPLDANPTYEELKKTPALSRNVLLYVWGSVFALTVGVSLWLRHRRIKHKGASPPASS